MNSSRCRDCWKTTYELEGAGAEPHGPKVVWHCVDEEADPWVAFAQLQDLPGMTCSRKLAATEQHFAEVEEPVPRAGT